MWSFSAQPIRRQIFAVTGLLVVPFALAVVWSAERTLREREAEVGEQTRAVAATAAAYLDQYLAGFDALEAVLARHPAVAGLDRERCDVLFAEILRGQPLLLNIMLNAPDGTVKGSGVPRPAVLGPVVGRPYIGDVVRSGRPVVSELSRGQLTGKPAIILGYPVVRADSQVVGVLGFTVDLTALQTVFSSIPLPEDSVITVTDAQSRVLARTRDAERYIGSAVDAQPVAPSDVRTNQVRTGIDGIPRYYGNYPIARGDWVLSVGIPTRVVAGRVTLLWRRNLLIVAATLGAILVLSLWLTRTLSGSLNGLRLAAQRIAGGDLSPPARAASPNREIADLQEAFIKMAANVRAAHHALDLQVEQERKMRETLQSLQRQVVRQERLAAVGVLVSGVAHELNNPLQAILGTAELLERSGSLPAELLEEVAFVKTQSGRAREIIRNLSRFSSQQSGPPSLVDLREVIAEVVQLRQSSLSESSIALSIDESTSRLVLANFTELEQVTLNFIINAQQSIEATGRNKGRIAIRLSESGKRIKLEVQDDGSGVAPEDEPKLFQPFFTTKPVGKGTGLGLSVSYGIIESYGGAIGCTGNDWGGATFFFELPVADAIDAPHSDDRPSVLHGSLRTKL